MTKIRLDTAQLQLPLSQVAQLLCSDELETTTFTFLTQAVCLRTNSTVARRWAELALTPHFTPGSERVSSTCYTIYLPETEMLEVMLPRWEPEPIRMHYGRQGLRWELGKNRDLIHEEKDNNWYLLDRTDRDVLFITTISDHTNYKEPTILVREMMLEPLPAEGYLPLHGSVAVLDKLGIAFLGNRGSGKTTMLLNLINQYRAEYATNDRFFVHWHQETKQLMLYSTPESCRVGFATMRTIPKLALHLRMDEHIEGVTLPLEKLRLQRRGKIAFLPQEIATIMNSHLVLQAPLQVMSSVMLNTPTCRQQLTIKLLNQEEIKQEIAGFVLYPDVEFCNWLRFDTSTTSWSPALMRTWEAVLSIPTYKAGGGENGNHLLKHLLDQMRDDQHLSPDQFLGPH